MLLLMTDTPPHVVGVRAVGKVNEVEYETILLPALEKAVKQYGKLNYIMVLETSVGNFTAGALQISRFYIIHPCSGRKNFLRSFQAP